MVKRTISQFLLLVLIALGLPQLAHAQNLIANIGDEVVWSTGSGSASPYSQYASNGQNSRVNTTGPYGTSVVAWQIVTANVTGANGGWTRDAISLSTNKTYRFTVWVRSESALNCSKRVGYLGNATNGASVNFSPAASGSATSQPQPLNANIQDDTWYLYVGYIGPNGYSGSADSGMYAIDNANPNVMPASSYAISDWAFPSGHSTIEVKFRSLIYNCGAGDVMYTYAPRIEEVNGSTKPLLDILYPNNSNPTPVSSVAITSSNVSVASGQTVQLNGTVLPSNANQTLLWTSSNTNVATVNSSGVVTGVANGTATITATSQENTGLFDVETVTVTAASSGGGSSGSSVWTETGSSDAIYYSSGNVGIGNTNPIRKLEVFDNNATLARFSGGHSGIQGIQVERQDGDHIRLVTNYTGFGAGLESSSKLRFAVDGNTINTPAMVLDESGNLGIGTQNIGTWKLAVAGSIRAEEIKVETGWADYVFEADYELRTLAELAAYIETHGHLPNIPSADEVAANGVKLGDMNRLLLEKIEELTLYILQQQKEIELLKEKR
ncbi:Ig-like domain-containing protein [Flagellimonas sp. DF-77]|uniref:Ig-like domain-containing protein n=1 Tax=Flagellimonas algarum TaxID=3230298 RepID=UPI0033975628